MKKLAIVITDGVGYRNFILSDFTKEAKVNFDKVVIFSCLPKTVYKNLNLNVEIVELEVFQESFKTWFFRKAKEVAHLQLHKHGNFGIQDNFNANKSTLKTNRGYATRFIYQVTALFYSEKWIQLYNQLQQLTFKNHRITKQYENLLIKYEIDLLFFTHQRPPYIAPLIYAAEKLNINTAAFIFSWDNLASKSRMAGNFNYYLVWSDLMKQDLLCFYKSIHENQIAIVGTPQFEPYTYERFGYDKNSFFNKFKLDSEKATILFTCNDSSSKNDPIYLEILAEFISDRKLVKEVNLVVRTSPAEEPERFKFISEKYPFIKWNYPDWKIEREGHQEAWSQRVPSIEDLSDLKSLLNYCDININVLSTITLDSFLFDKPVINPVFGNCTNGMFNDQKFLNYQHLVSLVESNATEIVKDENKFLVAINKILDKGDDHRSQERKNFIQLQIGKPLEGTSKRIAETLFQMHD